MVYTLNSSQLLYLYQQLQTQGLSSQVSLGWAQLAQPFKFHIISGAQTWEATGLTRLIRHQGLSLGPVEDTITSVQKCCSHKIVFSLFYIPWQQHPNEEETVFWEQSKEPGHKSWTSVKALLLCFKDTHWECVHPPWAWCRSAIEVNTQSLSHWNWAVFLCHLKTFCLPLLTPWLSLGAAASKWIWLYAAQQRPHRSAAAAGLHPLLPRCKHRPVGKHIMACYRGLDELRNGKDVGDSDVFATEVVLVFQEDPLYVVQGDLQKGLILPEFLLIDRDVLGTGLYHLQCKIHGTVVIMHDRMFPFNGPIDDTMSQM